MKRESFLKRFLTLYLPLIVILLFILFPVLLDIYYIYKTGHRVIRSSYILAKTSSMGELHETVYYNSKFPGCHEE